MTIANLTAADVHLRTAVMRELEWDTAVDASAIGVVAQGGTVTLTGYIDTYTGKLAAERAAKRVRGVRAVANEIDVRLRLERTDADIARDAARALELHSAVPDGVQAALHSGHLTLTGKVTWLFQKEEAERAVAHIRGVRNVLNHIVVVPRPAARDVRHRIVKALHDNADIDARRVAVSVVGDTATLSGQVETWLQRESVERAAANAPGIAHVENHILVLPAITVSTDDTNEIC